MLKFIPFTETDRNAIVKKRKGEVKFGETIEILAGSNNLKEQLEKSAATFVIFGIAEDIGVYANFGKIGTQYAWRATLDRLLNIQDNAFTNPKACCILGHIELATEAQEITTLQPTKKNIQKARELVTEIDALVAHIVSQIVALGKIPIAIGGGHNNAYGMLKGTSLALKKPINAVNFDAHTDFRKQEGRHSGNGFRYAFKEGFLHNYSIFGVHENYTSAKLFKTIDALKNIEYTTFETMCITQKSTFKKALTTSLNFINKTSFGIELDCDAIANISSSAETPSGFSAQQARKFIHFFAQQKNCSYLHICEAIPNTNNTVAKLIAYLITDFIKAKNNAFNSF